MSAKDLEETENGITNPKEIYKGIQADTSNQTTDPLEILQQYLFTCLTGDYTKLLYGVELNEQFSKANHRFAAFCTAHAKDTESAKAILFHSTLALLKTEVIPSIIRHYDIYCKLTDGYTDVELGVVTKTNVIEDMRYIDYDDSKAVDIETTYVDQLPKNREKHTIAYSVFPINGIDIGTVGEPVFEDAGNIVYNLLILRWLSKDSINAEENAYDFFMANVSDNTKDNFFTGYTREMFNHFVFKFALESYPRNLPSGRIYSIRNFNASNKLALTDIYCNNVTALRSFMSDITFEESEYLVISEESVIRNAFCLCATILAYEAENREFATLYAKTFMSQH